MENNQRDFKGVWIPKEVWLDTRLSMIEKGILVEIDSLDFAESGCFASNKHLADFCQCSETKASLAVSKLIELGYVYVESFDGRQRVLKSRLSKSERQNFKKCEADSQKVKGSNTIIKTSINTTSIINEILNEFNFSTEVKAKIIEWLEYKKEKKQSYKERGLRAFCKQRMEEVTKHGDKYVIECIDYSMCQNYSGVFPPKNAKGEAKNVNMGNNSGSEIKGVIVF
jgi:hypothetical protein